MSISALSTHTTHGVERGEVEEVVSPGLKISRVAKIVLHGLTVATALFACASIVAACVLATTTMVVLAVVTSLALAILLYIEILPFVDRHLPENASEILRTARAFVIDLVAKGMFAVLYPFSQTRFDPKKTKIEGQVPVLLVHGYMHNSSGWLYWRYRLEKMGYENVYTVDLGHIFHSIEEYAEKVQKRVREIQEQTGDQKVYLVGHSMGGIVNTYCALNLLKKEEVAGVVTIGSPLNGTALGKFGLGKCAKQMSFRSEFLQSLHSKKDESGISFFHIGSSADLIIRPSSSSVHSQDSGYKLFKYLGHVSLMLSDKVLDATINFLNLGSCEELG